MFRTFNLFTLRGIPIRVHGSLILLLIFLGLAWNVGVGLSGFLLTVLMLGLIFGFVLLHELGHSLVAQRHGIGVKDITLYPLGGIASLVRMPRKPSTEFQIAIAGPLVNLALAGFFALIRAFYPMALLGPLVQVNLALALFNLLPAFPLDGGRIFRAMLATRMPHAEATRIAARTGQGIAVILGFVGLLNLHVMLVLIAVFVFFAAQTELMMVLANRPGGRMIGEHFSRGSRSPWGRFEVGSRPGSDGFRNAGRPARTAPDRVVIEVLPDGTVRPINR